MTEELNNILQMQKRELEIKVNELYIQRDANFKKPEDNLIRVIIGPRRAGKSTFAIHRLKEFGTFAYINFDNEKLVELKDYDELLTKIKTRYNDPDYIVLDEIQNLPKWELFVNRLQRSNYKLVITGSNSNLLSGELATHLTGRYIPIYIFSFSFREFLNLKTTELTNHEKKAALDEFLSTGGYPEPLVKKLDLVNYISLLFDAIIYKDIVKRYKIRAPQRIENLANYLISNLAAFYSYNTLKDVTVCKSIHTIDKYIKYLEETFILFRIYKFSFKVKEQIRSNKKVYCFDNGFITAKAFKMSQDKGKIYENTVAMELKKAQISGKLKFYYWKNQQNEEIDFVITENEKISKLVQVCVDLANPDTKNREIRALLKGSRDLKCQNLIIITEDYDDEKEEEWFGIKGKIKYLPLWKWLLEKGY
ncbi:MAG: ATP-binding protein [Candidatus Micrarchaeota archaeon]